MILTVLPLLLLLVAVLGFVGATMVATHLLGPQRHTSKKQDAFECGVESVGDARSRFSVHYFVLAILFVLFDVEIIFFYPWAIQFRELGFIGFLEMAVFVLAIAVAFFYLLRHKVLDFQQESVSIYLKQSDSSHLSDLHKPSKESIRRNHE